MDSSGEKRGENSISWEGKTPEFSTAERSGTLNCVWERWLGRERRVDKRKKARRWKEGKSLGGEGRRRFLLAEETPYRHHVPKGLQGNLENSMG